MTTLDLLFFSYPYYFHHKYSKAASVQVIPPGMDFSNVGVQEDGPEVDGELAQLIADGSSPKAIPPIWSDVSVWFMLLHVKVC